MPVLSLNGVELYYDEFGAENKNGPVIIQAQQYNTKYLSYMKDLCEQEGFHGYAIRIRGYAPSSLSDQDYGTKWYEIWSQDVLDFADAVGADRFFYTGHSHGAGVGWHLCMKAPERIIAFFASGCGPHKKDGKATGSARQMTIDAAKSPETWKPFAEMKAAKGAVYFESMKDDPEIGALCRKEIEDRLEFWLNMKQESALINPGKPFPQCQTEEELIAALEQIHVPLLMFGGTDDAISTPELMLRTLKAVKGSELVLFEGVDHVNLVHRFRKEYVAHIMAFLKVRGLI